MGVGVGVGVGVGAGVGVGVGVGVGLPALGLVVSWGAEVPPEVSGVVGGGVLSAAGGVFWDKSGEVELRSGRLFNAAVCVFGRASIRYATNIIITLADKANFFMKLY